MYPNLIPEDRPVVPEIKINNDWLVGFIDGEGVFISMLLNLILVIKYD